MFLPCDWFWRKFMAGFPNLFNFLETCFAAERKIRHVRRSYFPPLIIIRLASWYFPRISPLWTWVRIPLGPELTCGLGFQSLPDYVVFPRNIWSFPYTSKTEDSFIVFSSQVSSDLPDTVLLFKNPYQKDIVPFPNVRRTFLAPENKQEFGNRDVKIYNSLKNMVST